MEASGAVVGGAEFQGVGAGGDPGGVLEDAAVEVGEAGEWHLRGALEAFVGVGFGPVLGDVDAAGEPDIGVGLGVVEEAFQARDFAGAADQAAVQADGEHFGLACLAFGIEGVEAVFQVLEELLAFDVAGGGGEAHVVRLQRVGDDQLVAVWQFHPVGQVVIVGVGQPLERAGFRGEAEGVDGGAACVPAGGRGAYDFGVQADGLGYGGAFHILGHVAVIDPFQAVGGDFPACGFHRGDLFGVAGKGGGDAVDGDGDVKGGEQAVQAPEACARAVIVERFHVGVALVWPRGGTCDVGEEGFGALHRRAGCCFRRLLRSSGQG